MPPETLVEFQAVAFRRGETHILEEIDWQVRPGEHWALLGPNGSGKTTLLDLLAGYCWPTKGSIRVLGEQYGRVDLRELRRAFGYAGASLLRLFGPDQPALEVALSGLDASSGSRTAYTSAERDRASAILETLGCAHLAARRFGVLSQGERQRCLLARALVTEPRLLILDEPCSGLDIRGRESLLDDLGRILAAPGAPALLYVTHHIEEISPAVTHALLLRGGRIVRTGKKDAALDSGSLSAAFGVRIEVHRRGGRYWPVVAGGDAR